MGEAMNPWNTPTVWTWTDDDRPAYTDPVTGEAIPAYTGSKRTFTLYWGCEQLIPQEAKDEADAKGGGYTLPTRYLAIIATQENALRGLLRAAFGKQPYWLERVEYYQIPQGKAAVWSHPIPDRLADKIQARFAALPLAVRSKVALLDVLPKTWVRVGSAS